MKPATKKLREVLRGMGVQPRQVRTDPPLGGTTATIFDEDSIASVVDHIPSLVEAGYGVVIRRFEDGTPHHALVTTDPRRAGVSDITATPIGGAR